MNCKGCFLIGTALLLGGLLALSLSLEAAQQLGLPADATIIADGAQSTYDEAVNIRRLARQHGWHSLIIVTDLFHTREHGSRGAEGRGSKGAWEQGRGGEGETNHVSRFTFLGTTCRDLTDHSICAIIY